jgi:hypothetical protein
MAIRALSSDQLLLKDSVEIQNVRIVIIINLLRKEGSYEYRYS